ncbi:RluA family pseudouridine synthase [Anaplasmataceae bacterium AB001_6]|nr:RluA family pseudouridine synthase [Anaplasmataceae bacterium AB001_6]
MNKNSGRLLTVHCDNIRLDRFLREHFKSQEVFNIPQSYIEKSVREGMIRVDETRTKSSFILNRNNTVSIDSDVNFLIFKKDLHEKKVVNFSARDLEKITLYEDEFVIVIDKPYGLSVQGGAKIGSRNLIDSIKNIKVNYIPYVVHRIDKHTSGVLVIAKNKENAQYFSNLFANRKVYKKYTAIVLGKVKKPFGVIRSFIDNKGCSITDNKFINSITHYKLIDSSYNVSFIELIPLTGKKHQIRLHMKLIDNPILGDVKYSKYNYIDNIRYKKLNLCAKSIRLNLPNKNIIDISTVEPNHMIENINFFF